MKKILVVDDEETARVTLEALLEKEGYEVVLAENGSAAIEKIKQGSFDAALVDLVMPGMDGIRVLEEIKKLKPETKVIMITGFGTIESAVEAMKKGASNYVSKPFKKGEIQSIIKRVLEEAKFEERGESPFETFKNLLGKRHAGMCVSSRTELLKKYGLENAAPLPASLEELSSIISDFAQKNENAAVLVDGFERFLSENSLEEIERFVSGMNNLPLSSKLIVSYNPREIDAKVLREFMRMTADPYTHLISEILANPIRRDGIRFLHSSGGAIFTRIKQELRIKDAPKLSFHLRFLKSAGMIGQEEKRYFLTKRGEKVHELLAHLDQESTKNMQNVLWLKSD